MKPISFKEQTNVIAKDQPEYLPLPAMIDINKGSVVCCWKLTFKERIKLLFSGLLWHKILTFGSSLQPQVLTVNKKEVIPQEIYIGYPKVTDEDVNSIIERSAVDLDDPTLQ